MPSIILLFDITFWVSAIVGLSVAIYLFISVFFLNYIKEIQKLKSEKEIKDIESIALFDSKTTSHEVFAIKDGFAYVGCKVQPYGNFYYEKIPYTEPKQLNESK